MEMEKEIMIEANPLAVSLVTLSRIHRQNVFETFRHSHNPNGPGTGPAGPRKANTIGPDTLVTNQ